MTQRWARGGILLSLMLLACSADDEFQASDDAGPNARPGDPKSDGGAPPASVSTVPSPRWVGRFQATAAGRKAAWSGSFVEARFKASKITLHLKDSASNRFVVTLDGSETRFVAKAGVDAYVLGEGLTPSEHVIRVEKDTEANVGETEFINLELDPAGTFLPIAAPARRIEIIGDSISCGYGNLGIGPKCDFSAETESFHKTYGAVLGRKYGADVVDVCISGIGLYRNNGGSTSNTMPTRYDRTLPSSTSSTWDFSKFTPDLVIINLMTNDFTGSSPPEQAFETAYDSFLSRVRKNYPSAFLLSVAGGPMLYGSGATNALAWIRNVVEKQRAAGDQHIDIVELPTQTGSHGGYGCDYHPSVGEHVFMADQMADKIGTALGW